LHLLNSQEIDALEANKRGHNLSIGAMALGRKRLMMIVLARDWKKSKKQLCALTLGLQARDPTL
jgi:hypothetical protein